MNALKFAGYAIATTVLATAGVTAPTVLTALGIVALADYLSTS